MESLHYLLLKSNALFHKRIVSEMGRIGLTPGQPKVLEYLRLYGEADQKTIAAYCEIEPATVGSILLRMEDAGLILRRQKAGNRRSLYVSLTDKGRQAAGQVEETFTRFEEEATRGLSPQEVETLRELLSKLYSSLQTYTKKEKESI